MFQSSKKSSKFYSGPENPALDGKELCVLYMKNGLFCECWQAEDNWVYVCVGVDVPKWTSELSSRSLLLASRNRYGLAVNFDNTWAKQKYHVPNPSVNKERWGKDTYDWSCVVLLHVDYLDWEDWLLGIPESRGAWKEGLPLRRCGNEKEKEAYEEEGKDPG